VNSDTYYDLYLVKYEEGILKAIALNQSKKVADHILKSAGQPYQLELQPEKETVKISKGELVFIPVEVTDKNGVRCPNATNNQGTS
jgi:beta-galactosidase